MILYKDNPNIAKLAIVTTIQGDKEYRRNCRYIKGEYYVKDRDCFGIDGKYYRKTSPNIVKDYELNKWVLKDSPNLTYGIVVFKSGKPIMGYFTKNVYNNCLVITNESGKVSCLNVEFLPDNNYFEDLGNGIWYDRASVTNGTHAKMTTIRSEHNYTNKGYNIEDNKEEFKNKKSFYKNHNPKLDKEVRAYAKYLGDITYGLEMETSAGNIPDYIQNRTGLVACRDGSIASAEYVTVPMSGAKGLANVYSVSEALTKRCNIDISCSFHIHIGTLPLSRDYISALYILGYRIQDDIFKMFPYYKTNPEGIKRKNYCQKLKKLSIQPLLDSSKISYTEYINDVYGKIFNFLSEGQRADDEVNRRNRQHPRAEKWNRISRYFFINFINTIFSERETVEFRLHQATLNSQRMINWLFITAAICKYAERNMQLMFSSMDKVKMEDVLNVYRDSNKGDERAAFLSEYLIAYYKDRCKFFKNDFDNNDYLSESDLKNDKNYRFSYKGVFDLF